MLNEDQLPTSLNYVTDTNKGESQVKPDTEKNDLLKMKK
jgi:hypothetical protein